MTSLFPRTAEALGTILKFFQSYRVNYMLTGGLVLGVWGRPRTTLDIDFLILTGEDGFERLKRAAGREHVMDKKWSRWNPLIRNVQMRLRIRGVLIDIMLPRDKHDEFAFRRKKRKRLGKFSYAIIAPEDFIIQKLKVGRPQDFQDALTVLERMRAKLDLSYVRRWARKLGVSNQLAYVLSA